MSFGVDPELFATAYDVPVGHRLALVAGTVDPLCAEHDLSGGAADLLLAPADPSLLSVPLREE